MADVRNTRTRTGRQTEMRACLWLASQGYEVFANVFPDGPIDLMAVRLSDGEVLKIEVKSALTSRLSERQVELGVHLLVHERATDVFHLLAPEEGGARPRCKPRPVIEISADDMAALILRRRADQAAALAKFENAR